MIRGRLIAGAVVVVVFLSLAVVSTRIFPDHDSACGRDVLAGVEYRHIAQARAEAGSALCLSIILDSGSAPETSPVSVKVVHSVPNASMPAVVMMHQLEGSDIWACALPSFSAGTAVGYYFVVEYAEGKVFNVPESASGTGKRFTVEYQDRLPAAISIALIASIALAAGVLLHGLYRAVLFLSARFPDKGGAREALHQAHLLASAAVAILVVLVIPISIAAGSIAAGGRTGDALSGGLFQDLSRTAAVAALFACLLVFRIDLFRRRADPRPRADVIYAILYTAACAITIMAAVLP